jgi:N-acetylated-alpha-linked acidic dipeptidase
MRQTRLLALLAAAPLILGAAPATEPALSGFSDSSARVERGWEAKFQAIPDPANLREYMKRLSAHPHHVGSAYDKDNAEWILSKFKEWGLDAHIETFDVLFPTPKERRVEMIAPTKFVASLKEPPLAVVSVKGAIVIARYGHSWRGIKPKMAAEHGAIGCLI